MSTGPVLSFHTHPLPSSLLSKPAPPARFIPWLIILTSRGVILHSFTQETFLEPLSSTSAGQDTHGPAGNPEEQVLGTHWGREKLSPGCYWKRGECLTWLIGLRTDFWELVTPELSHETQEKRGGRGRPAEKTEKAAQCAWGARAGCGRERVKYKARGP